MKLLTICCVVRISYISSGDLGFLIIVVEDTNEPKGSLGIGFLMVVVSLLAHCC